MSPVLAFLHQKFGDGGGVFGDAPSFGFIQLTFLPLSLLHAVVPWRGAGFGRWILGRRLDKIGGKDHIEGAVHHHLEDLVKGDKAIFDHQAVANFLALRQPTLNPDFHRAENLCWEVAIGGNAPLKIIFSVLIALARELTPATRELPEPKRMEVMPK